MFYWVLLGFTGFLPSFIQFLLWFYWVFTEYLPSFNGLRRASPEEEEEDVDDVDGESIERRVARRRRRRSAIIQLFKSDAIEFGVPTPCHLCIMGRRDVPEDAFVATSTTGWPFGLE